MTPYYSDDLVTLYHGDCREVLASMAAQSVDCVITDPPYSDNTHENTRSNSQGAKRHGNRVLSGNFGFDAVTGGDVLDVLSECGRVTRRWVVANLDYRHVVPMHEAPPTHLRLLRVGVWVKTNPNPQISGDRTTTPRAGPAPSRGGAHQLRRHQENEMSNNLAANMVAAWTDRANRAADEIAALRKAPAFFTEERIERTVTDYRRAQAEVARWSR